MKDDKPLVSLEQAEQYCLTTAKFVAMWHDNDEHLENKVAVCLVFVGHIQKVQESWIEDNWNTLVEDYTACEPEAFRGFNKIDLYVASCYFSMLHEEVLVNSYESWLDDVTDIHRKQAKEFIQHNRLPLKKFYLSFGCGEENVNRRRYAVIEATDYEKARAKVFERFGTKWAFIYTEEDWYRGGRPQHDKYGYTILE